MKKPVESNRVVFLALGDTSRGVGLLCIIVLRCFAQICADWYLIRATAVHKCGGLP